MREKCSYFSEVAAARSSFTIRVIEPGHTCCWVFLLLLLLRIKRPRERKKGKLWEGRTLGDRLNCVSFVVLSNISAGAPSGEKWKSHTRKKQVEDEPGLPENKPLDTPLLFMLLALASCWKCSLTAHQSHQKNVARQKKKRCGWNTSTGFFVCVLIIIII